MNLRIGLLTRLNCFVFRRGSRSQQVLSKAETVVVFAGRCDFSRSSFNFTYLPADLPRRIGGRRAAPILAIAVVRFRSPFRGEKRGREEHPRDFLSAQKSASVLSGSAGKEATTSRGRRRAQSARDIFRAFILGCLCGVTLAGKKREGANGPL